ncbi:MAG: hypothetical protein H0T79_20455 [Deltaproteobacteria bacterium]|nr:hypothetical protein [Deltaproteobacteria bacterium]
MKVRDVEHLGLAAIELVERGTRLVLVHAVGPRIAWFGRARADNLLFWDLAGEHRRGAWQLRGGHRLWLTRPGADESDETYLPDNAPCRVRRTTTAVTATAPIVGGLERSLAIDWSRDAWMIIHRIRNASELLWSGGIWALTCTEPRRGTEYRIPLGGGPPAWDVTTIVVPRRWGGTHTSRVDDPQIELTDDAVVVRPQGARSLEAKRMILAPRGTLEMIDPTRGTFSKTAAYDRTRRYPLDTNVACYVGPRSFMVELETMGPLVTLAPGESLTHVERWALR